MVHTTEEPIGVFVKYRDESKPSIVAVAHVPGVGVFEDRGQTRGEAKARVLQAVADATGHPAREVSEPGPVFRPRGPRVPAPSPGYDPWGVIEPAPGPLRAYVWNYPDWFGVVIARSEGEAIGEALRSGKLAKSATPAVFDLEDNLAFFIDRC